MDKRFLGSIIAGVVFLFLYLPLPFPPCNVPENNEHNKFGHDATLNYASGNEVSLEGPDQLLFANYTKEAESIKHSPAEHRTRGYKLYSRKRIPVREGGSTGGRDLEQDIIKIWAHIEIPY